MTYYVSSGTLNSTHLENLVCDEHTKTQRRLVKQQY